MISANFSISVLFPFDIKVEVIRDSCEKLILLGLLTPPDLPDLSVGELSDVTGTSSGNDSIDFVVPAKLFKLLATDGLLMVSLVNATDGRFDFTEMRGSVLAFEVLWPTEYEAVR